MKTGEEKYRTERIEVEGMVQGVGFRPFVHSLAEKHSVGGYVANTPDGVLIEIEGPPAALDEFVRDLEQQAPPLSRIVSVTRKPVPLPSGKQRSRLYNGFEIRESVRGGQPVTLIPPDVCICDECLAELFDPRNRRYLYPFINCTNCGPRFTIIRGLPYDRPLTTMAEFAMCSGCGSEYADPSDRRFHAQPNACPVCGPHVSLVDSSGKQFPGDPVVKAIDLLRDGRIVAVKGLGGFHLAVDGANNEAVMRLRRRKNREEKPLALMVGTLADARRLIAMRPDEEQILTSRERPILLSSRALHEHGEPPVTLRLNRGAGGCIADSVAPRNPQLGVMLPYTPLHYLLFFHPEAGGDFHHDRPVFSALIMTSGNLSEEPVCKDNGEALEHLAGVADAFLLHNRDIHVRCDDSVVRSTAGDTMFIRRSRGFAPVPVFLPERSAPVLAFGGELKNTLCLVEGRRAFMSQHIGDLENIPTLDFFREAVTHFTGIFNIEPVIYAYDLHPEYLSTKYFMSLRETLDPDRYGSVGVQHHHAHIAGVMAEHGISDPVIGFSMDGTGYGLDGTVWGGEVLLCTPVAFTRAAKLSAIPMPGGTSAVRAPWRMAFSCLRESFGDEVFSLDLPCLKRIPREHLEVLARACDTGLNCPRTSSLGRLFDAAASILDIRHETAFEGQAAMELEMLAVGESGIVPLPCEILPDDTAPLNNAPVLWGTVRKAAITEKPLCEISYTIDYRPLVRALVEELHHGKPRSVLALSFHIAILTSFLDIAERIRESTGIAAAALSGGCWQNRILSERFQSMLRDRGFTVLAHRQVPPNDGGLALGQAYVASNICRLNTKEESPCVLQYR